MYRSYKKLAVLITCCLTASLLQAQQVDLFKM